jgi:hypothetical protein
VKEKLVVGRKSSSRRNLLIKIRTLKMLAK